MNSSAKEEKGVDKLRIGQKEENVFSTEKGHYRQGSKEKSFKGSMLVIGSEEHIIFGP